MTNRGWICPKCERVYATYISECKHCNDKVADLQKILNRPDRVVRGHPSTRSGGGDGH